jgi:xanthine dehydrogenase YagT iron-sulfur-binding subunit
MAVEIASWLVRRAPGTWLVALMVIGQADELFIQPRLSLLDALRQHLVLTGSEKRCDQGTCAACTVWVNGRRVLACLTLAAGCAGHEVLTARPAS